MILDYLRYAISNLTHRKLRSWLTVIGIFIGIAAVVSLISLGQGLQNAINQQFSTIGADRLIIQAGTSEFFGPPGTAGGTSMITEDDLKVIERVRGVDDAAGFLLKPTKVEFNNIIKFTFGFGVSGNPRDIEIIGSRLDISSGRFFKEGEKFKVVVAHDLTTNSNIFGKVITLGDKIKIEGKTFEVVGVRKKLGDPGSDTAVILPLETMRELFNTENELSLINAKVSEGFTPSLVAEDVKKSLRKSRNLKEGNEDFTVQTSEELISSFNTILVIVQAVLIGIAAISLIVGGIGIMNTMYTSVVERTKEIGIMKAVGAKNSDILLIFLIESGLLGMVGGAIGIAIGIGIGKLVEFIAAQALGTTLIQAFFPWYLILGALLFSFVVGSIAGLLPARQAASMQPVQALRYE